MTEEGSMPPVKSAHPNGEAWTVAIYMNADGSSGSNDLDQVAIRELGDIVRTASAARTGKPNPIKVAVQLDLHRIDGMLRLTVEDEGNVNGLFYPEANVAGEDTLKNFFEWVSTACRSDRYLVLFAAIGVVVFVARAAARYCWSAPGRRRRLIVAAIVLLGACAALVPWVFADLDPPWSESPAGIFVYLGKAALAGSLGLVGLGALIGALMPARHS